ncbi:MAG: hypothetical protein ACLFQB_01335 [Chitinispirillaceae bacterium]
MSIREEIVKALRSRLVLRFTGDQVVTSSCIVCSREVELAGPLSIYAPDEGYVCDSCAKQFCPELIEARKTCLPHEAAQKKEEVPFKQQVLSSEDIQELDAHFEVLLSQTPTLVKGISRGIIEAPTSHIGLLHLLKNIPKPPRREGEDEKDYELRVKTVRTNRLREKLNEDVCGRIERIRKICFKVCSECNATEKES